ncbi:MAG TPA: DinB family protein [Chryseolinea sp.]|nr:DinB family protein [Chryseolinea sp.]HPM28975.1 DinB family protein [Chryseolinea sp.]
MYSIHKHLTFNVWANTKTAEVLRNVEDGIFFRENKSSFPSIAKTVIHMWGAQSIWLTRMQGTSLTTFPHIELRDKMVSLDGLVKSAEDIQKFIESKDEAFLTSTYAYKNMKGDPFENSYEETLFHVVNHSTYHRGQIITMLRDAGVTNVVGTDLIHYLRTLKK